MATEIESAGITDTQCLGIADPNQTKDEDLQQQTQHNHHTQNHETSGQPNGKDSGRLGAAGGPMTGDPTGEGQRVGDEQGNKEKKSEIRVYKKSSLNGKITVYLGKRDFVDHIAYVDPIDGVVLIDREYVKDKRVFGHILATFSYGRDDLDVLGLTFRKELYLVNEQIYPDTTRRHYSKACPYYIEGVSDKPSPLACGEESTIVSKHNDDPRLYRKPQRPLTKLQERLVKKLGPNAFPFFFELPPLCPASVTLQPGPGDSGKPCGVDYELKAYIANSLDEKPSKRDSIRLAIRKIMYAPSKQGEQPMVEVSKDFMMSPNKLNLEVSLDKELYYHGESIAVNVHISNNSNRTVKKVKVSVRQFADICLFSTAQYKCTVAEIESEEGCPVGPGSTLSKVYYLRPLLAFNKDKRGLALDGQLKHEDTNLASSTLLTDSSQKENLGIVVQYKVRVKLALGPLGGDISAELPVTLMHPKPAGEDDALISKSSPIGLTLAGPDGLPRRGSNSQNPLESIFGKTMACKCDQAQPADGSARAQSSSKKGGSELAAGGDGGTDINNDPTQAAALGSSGPLAGGDGSAGAGVGRPDEQNLIQLDDDNDIIFEDFARLRMDTTELSSSQRSNEDLDQQQLHYQQQGSQPRFTETTPSSAAACTDTNISTNAAASSGQSNSGASNSTPPS